MEKLARKDYIQMIYTLFDQFEQQTTSSRRGRPFTYAQKVLAVELPPRLHAPSLKKRTPPPR